MFSERDPASKVVSTTKSRLNSETEVDFNDDKCPTSAAHSNPERSAPKTKKSGPNNSLRDVAASGAAVKENSSRSSSQKTPQQLKPLPPPSTTSSQKKNQNSQGKTVMKPLESSHAPQQPSRPHRRHRSKSKKSKHTTTTTTEAVAAPAPGAAVVGGSSNRPKRREGKKSKNRESMNEGKNVASAAAPKTSEKGHRDSERLAKEAAAAAKQKHKVRDLEVYRFYRNTFIKIATMY